MKKHIVLLVLILNFLASQPAALGWGVEGHVFVNEAAAQKIPDTMPAFLRAASDQLGYLGPEPDRWREMSEYTLKESQEPDHFIGLERIAWMSELPRGRYEFYQMLYERRCATKDNSDNLLPQRVGLQPYATIEVYDRLKVAFREYRNLKSAGKPTDVVEHDAIFYAGWLGHYVADGAMPLHTSIDYDGWVEKNPKGYTTVQGIHGKFESDFVGRNIALADIGGLVGGPVRLQDPFRDYVKYLRESKTHVEEVYQIDKAGGFDGKGSPEALAFTKARLAAGSQMLLNLWYTAWVESAEPRQ